MGSHRRRLVSGTARGGNQNRKSCWRGNRLVSTAVARQWLASQPVGQDYLLCTVGRRLISITGELGLPTMSPKFFVRLRVMTLGILGLAFVAGQPTSATAQSYPWCAQGDNILHCYYVTREQCEAAVNNHGFCTANSSVPTPNNEAPQRPLRRRRRI